MMAKTLESILKSPPRIKGIPKGFVSTRVLANSLGISQSRAWKQVRALFDEGKVEVSSGELIGMSGKPTNVPVYKFKGRK